MIIGIIFNDLTQYSEVISALSGLCQEVQSHGTGHVGIALLGFRFLSVSSTRTYGSDEY